MEFILSQQAVGSNELIELLLLIFATGRIYLEIIGFNFDRLPITSTLSKTNGKESLRKFHKMGFYFSVGYLILFAPTYLLS